MPSRLHPRDFLHNLDDVRIGAAAAEIAAHPLAYFFSAEPWLGVEIRADMARNARFDLVEHGHRRADLAGRAIAALIAVMLHESRLHRMQSLGRAEPLDRGDAVALVHHGK